MEEKYLEIIGIILGGSGFIWATLKFFKSALVTSFLNRKYLYTDGLYVLRDIEEAFGKDAGQGIKNTLIKMKGNDIMHQTRLGELEHRAGLNVFICDSEGKCLFANKGISDLFQRSPEEMKGFGWTAPIIDRQQAFTSWKLSVEQGLPYRDSYQIKQQGGTVLDCMAEADPYSVDGVQMGFIGIVKQISK